MTSKAELACVYSAFILVDSDVAVTGEKISTILKVANVFIDPYWPNFFARALEGVNIKDLITNTGFDVGSAATVGPAAAAAVPVEAAKKKMMESEVEESDDVMGFGLFD